MDRPGFNMKTTKIPTSTDSASGSEIPTTDATTEGSILETDLQSIINKLSPLLGPLPPGQSRKVKYEKGGTSVEIKVPIEDKEKCFSMKEIKPEGQAERKGRAAHDVDKKYKQVATDVSSSESVPKTPQRSSLYTSDETSIEMMSSKTDESNSLTLPRVPCTSSTCIPPPCEPPEANPVKRHTDAQEMFEPDAKKTCPSATNLPCSQGHQDNIGRYSCNHGSHGHSKRRIKWCNYLPSFPSVPASLPKSSEQKSKVTFKKYESDDSGVTIPQLYKAHVGTGSYPNRFTFRAVTGAQNRFSGREYDLYQKSGARRYPAGDPYESQFLLAPQMQHYPRLITQPPFVKAGPCSAPSQREPSMQGNKQNPTCIHRPVFGVPPPSSSYPGCQPAVTQRICDDCQKVDMGLDPKAMAMPAPNSVDYEVDPEKARAFLGEKGEGYISVNTIPERVDVYCFDQLNTGFFRTSDHPPPLFSDVAVETTEAIATRFWAEVFGMVNIVIAFLVAMVLQFFKFLLTAIVRPLMIGFVQLFSDYFIKPLLTVIYNGFTQPVSVCFYNVVASIRDIVNPIAKAFGFFIEPFANIVKSFRLVEIKHVYSNPGQAGPAAVPLVPRAPSTIKIQ
ncbi:uncharacterized protein LOC106661940 [Cimex lectularius]|uniref:Uncharacterized protein n=1 Tax=Cimex lectularius TaxID=79782 RepID=A0A8I6RC43_CIMLE|nr:uncharacterized protein LOC106661940 [Cimex lectularius]